MSSSPARKKRDSKPRRELRYEDTRVSSAASAASNRSFSPDHEAYKLSRSFTAIGDEFNIKDEDFGITSRPATSAASLRSMDQLPIGHNAEERIARRAMRSSSPPSEMAVREIMKVSSLFLLSCAPVLCIIDMNRLQIIVTEALPVPSDFLQLLWKKSDMIALLILEVESLLIINLILLLIAQCLLKHRYLLRNGYPMLDSVQK
jgi:hypothetical protein